MNSVVEGKSVEEMDPKPRDKVHIKDGNGTWEGIVYTCGMFHPGRNFHSICMFDLLQTYDHHKKHHCSSCPPVYPSVLSVLGKSSNRLSLSLVFYD